jgi:uncharacterized protein YndB with AHSA1/START domain
MRFVRRVGIFFLVIIVLAVGVAFLLPSQYKVERTVVIQAKPEAIYPLVSQLKRWEEWSPWTKELDPTMTQTYSGPEGGTGAVMSWTGERTGSGSMKVTKGDPAHGIAYDLDFENGGSTSSGVILFEPEADGGTQVRWTNVGDAGLNPVRRYINLMLDKWIGEDFRKGLDKLKQKVEAKK